MPKLLRFSNQQIASFENFHLSDFERFNVQVYWIFDTCLVRIIQPKVRHSVIFKFNGGFISVHNHIYVSK